MVLHSKCAVLYFAFVPPLSLLLLYFCISLFLYFWSLCRRPVLFLSLQDLFMWFLLWKHRAAHRNGLNSMQWTQSSVWENWLDNIIRREWSYSAYTKIEYAVAPLISLWRTVLHRKHRTHTQQQWHKKYSNNKIITKQPKTFIYTYCAFALAHTYDAPIAYAMWKEKG